MAGRPGGGMLETMHTMPWTRPSPCEQPVTLVGSSWYRMPMDLPVK